MAFVVAATTMFIQPVSALEGDASFRGTNGYGVDFSGGWSWDTPSVKEENLDEIDSLGLDWVRLNAFWYQIQGTNSTSYDWGLLDDQVSRAVAHNKRILIVGHTTPEWARPAGAPTGDAGNKYAPQDVAAYATFMRAVVERYAPQGVLDYEVWNEPNNVNFWKDTVANPNPNVAHYSQLLSAAASAMRSQNAGVNIITGGLAPAGDSASSISPRTFLTQLYANGAKSSFDAVGMHPYSYPELPSHVANWNPWQQMSNDTGVMGGSSMRTIMANNGDSAKKIWLTEFGAPTSGGPDAVTETKQREIYLDAITLHKSYDWVGPLFFYSLDDWAPYGAQTDREYYFGLRLSNGVHKGAFSAVQSAIADTTNPTVGNYNSSHPAGVWSGTVTLQPAIADNVAVSRVQLLVDGTVVSTDTSSPYQFSVNTNDYVAGSSHTITIRAFDTSDNQVTGAPLTFSVAAAPAPADDPQAEDSTDETGNTEVVPGAPNTGVSQNYTVAGSVLVIGAAVSAILLAIRRRWF